MPRGNLSPEPVPLNPTIGWSTGGSATTAAASGTVRGYAWLLSSGSYVVSPRAAVTAGLDYTGSVHVYSDAADTTVTLYLNWWRANGSFLSSASTPITFPAGAWTRYSLTATAPTDAASCDVTIDGFNASFSPIRVTGCMVEQASTLGTYEDGDSPGWTWDGAAGASTSSEAGGTSLLHLDAPAAMVAGWSGDLHRIGVAHVDRPTAVSHGNPGGALQIGVTHLDTATATTAAGGSGVHAVGLAHRDTPSAVATSTTGGLHAAGIAHHDRPGAALLGGPSGVLVTVGGDVTAQSDGLHEDQSLKQGLDWGRAWQMVDDAGEPLDITGWTVLGQIRRRPGQPLLHEWSADAGNVAATGYPASSGWVVITVPWSTSAGWSFAGAVCAYGVILITTTGGHLPVVYGSFYVEPFPVVTP